MRTLRAGICMLVILSVIENIAVLCRSFLCRFRPRASSFTHNSKRAVEPRTNFIMPGHYIWVIDQVWGQDGCILAEFFYGVFMDRDEVEVHKLVKKERGQYPDILTEQTCSIKDLLYGFRGDFSCVIRRVVPSKQDGSILPARVASHITRFGSSCPLAELAI